MRVHLLILGSNITPEAALPRARAALREEFGELRESCVVLAPPVGAPETPDFHNQALLIASELDASELRQRLREIEARLGRVRVADRNAPRIIDIDRAASLEVSELGEARAATRPLEAPPADPELFRFPHLFVPAAELLPRLVAPGGTLTLADLAGDASLLPAGFRRLETTRNRSEACPPPPSC
ncbi:MAG: 2-amino-4-hydroxy-6-hydroxymethyldihydropteridine diphosphokinase [Planctomycetota bacterium]